MCARSASSWQQRAPAIGGRCAVGWPPGATSVSGVGCRASGVLGLDVDRHGNGVDGLAAFAWWCRAQGQDWPETFTVASPNQGLHLYFHVPPGVVVPSTSGGRSGLGPGIDTRGPCRRSGGYLLAPGSVIDARRYRIEADVPIAEMPRWLRQILATAQCDRTATGR